MIYPFIHEEEGGVERTYNIFSRLLKDRIIFLMGEVNDEMANTIIAQLLYLNAQDKEKDITMYINSPGGSVTAGLGIYDTMKHINCKVSTVCIGQAASMGAFLLAAGEKGKRFSLPNSRIMIHQVLGGINYSQATDVDIHAKEMLRIKDLLNEEMAKNVGKSKDTVEKDTDRDNFMSANEAVEYGIIDKVI